MSFAPPRNMRLFLSRVAEWLGREVVSKPGNLKNLLVSKPISIPKGHVLGEPLTFSFLGQDNTHAHNHDTPAGEHSISPMEI